MAQGTHGGDYGPVTLAGAEALVKVFDVLDDLVFSGLVFHFVPPGLFLFDVSLDLLNTN